MDPDGTLSQLCITDYFVDQQTYLIAKSVDMTHPDATYLESYSHEIDLGNYATAANGINVPMLVAEKVGGQTIWQAQLSSISFNTGLSDANFVLQ